MIGLVGMGSPQISVGAFEISTEECSLVGSFCYSRDDFEDAVGLVAAGTSDLARLISRELSPDEAPAAFASLASGDTVPGKLIVRLDL